MEKIKKIIGEKLDEIEVRENIKILHCVESGSRAWGFPSPDSDYDVRFIYVRPKEFYLKLEKTRDVIEWQLDETLDINGWDLQKALRLLHNSNPTLFEWNNSPIVYKTTDEWGQISKILNEYFSKRAGLHHYLNTAKSNFREYLKRENVKLKKYFYVLRPLLACEHIKEYGTPPPMLFDEMLHYLEGDVLIETEKLLQLKAVTSELGEGKQRTVINEYIDKKIIEFDDYTKTVSADKNKSWDKLNSMFLSMLD